MSYVDFLLGRKTRTFLFAAVVALAAIPARADNNPITTKLAAALFPNSILVCGPLTISAPSPTTLHGDGPNGAFELKIKGDTIYVGGHPCELRCKKAEERQC